MCMQIQKISFNTSVKSCYSSKMNNKTGTQKSNVFSKPLEKSIYYKANYLVPFTSLKMQASNRPNDYCDTFFYRDSYTLKKAADILMNTFPEGADIMDFACSNGEEAISFYSLINETPNSKYNFYCYDRCKKVIDLADTGIHTVYSLGSGDRFLIDRFAYDNNSRYLKERFNNTMEEINEPDLEINDSKFIHFMSSFPEFKIKYYKLKDEYKNLFEFENGDIHNIDTLGPEKAGAVFFRNAFYIPSENYALDEFDIKETESEVDKQEVVNEIVDKIYDKLLPGGILVLGNIIKDHIYLAGENVSNDEKIYVPGYGCYIYKNSPLHSALEKNGRFKPVVYANAAQPFEDVKVPTVWQKVN